jgi:hypothetical protein
MGFNVSGLIGAGAQDALADLLQRQMVEQQLKERTRQFDEEQSRRQSEDAEQSRQFGENLRQRQSESDQRASEAQQVAEHRDRARRDQNNAEGVQSMLMQRRIMDEEEERNRPKPVKLREVRTRGEKGQPVNRMVPEDESVDEYVAPQRESGGRVDVRSVQSRGPNGEPGTKTMVFRDGTLSEEHWEPANPSAAERKDFGDFNTLATGFEAVKEAHKAYPSTGPVMGRLGAVAQVMPGVKTPEGFTNLRSRLAQVQNSLLYLKSGKAISEPEFQRMMKELPSENDKGPDFIVKLANAESVMQEWITNRKGAAGVPTAATPAQAPGGGPGLTYQDYLNRRKGQR